jgi:hypothetical protein
MSDARHFGSVEWRQKVRAAIGKMSALEPSTDCWLWLGGRSAANYGVVSIGRGQFSAHRAAFYAFQDLMPDGRELDHLCDNTLCVNPAHLEPVTKTENLKRRWATRDTVHREFCSRGHAMVAENVSLLTSGYRRCRECEKLLNRERYQKRRNAGTAHTPEAFNAIVRRLTK